MEGLSPYNQSTLGPAAHHGLFGNMGIGIVFDSTFESDISSFRLKASRLLPAVAA